MVRLIDLDDHFLRAGLRVIQRLGKVPDLSAGDTGGVELGYQRKRGRWFAGALTITKAGHFINCLGIVPVLSS